MKSKKVAIIGTGISGLTCGYYLSKNNWDITLYEADDYIGGHTHTVRVEKGREVVDIDTGFIVFNDRTYPNFIKMMKEIGVSYQPTEMSFSARNDDINLEYNGNTLNTLFAQRSNLFRPRFIRMVADIIRFNKDVIKNADNQATLTLGEYLERNSYTSYFKDNYLLPMISAIWSMGLKSCLDFPLQFFVRFFDNHGLLQLSNRPQWYTIVGGSSRYIEPLTARFKEKIQLNCKVRSVKRADSGVMVETPSGSEHFDEVIFACHGDQALALLSDPSIQEMAVLGAFKFNDNRVILHTDVSFLPKKRRAWASWNYQLVDAAKEVATLTYNMNILQCLKKQNTYLVTLNQEVDERHILKEFSYSHPVYTVESVKAQQLWPTISGRESIHYCGAYWINGFHEDGVNSALRVCEMLEGRL